MTNVTVTREGEADDDDVTVSETREEIRVNRKEGEKVVLLAFPTRAQLPGWRRSVARALVTTSAMNDQLEILWISEVYKVGKKSEDFESSGEDRFKSLDQKLAVALHGVLKGGAEKGRAISEVLHVEEDKLFQRGKITIGRQVLWLINEHFRTNHTTDHASDMVDLVSLQWFVENMTKFRYTWDSCVQSMYPPLPDETLRDILYKKLAPSKVLREDLCHFDRQEQGHPHRTYAWLRGRIDYHIIRQLQDKNQAEKTSMFRGKQGAPLDPSAAPAKAKPKTKATADAAASKGKAKGKGGGGKGKGGNTGGGNPTGGGVDPKAYEGVCYFFQEGSCRRGADCRFEHRKLNAKTYAAMPKPMAVSRSNSPAEKKKKEKGKGRGKGKRSESRDRSQDKRKAGPKAGARLSKLWCAAFLKGECKRGENCRFPHHDQAAVDRTRKAMDNNKSQ